MANAKDYLFRAVTGLHRRIFLATDGLPSEPDGEGELMRLHSIRFTPHSN